MEGGGGRERDYGSQHPRTAIARHGMSCTAKNSVAAFSQNNHVTDSNSHLKIKTHKRQTGNDSDAPYPSLPPTLHRSTLSLSSRESPEQKDGSGGSAGPAARRTGTGAAARGRRHGAGRACAARRRRGRARRAQAWARVQEEQRRGRSTATNLPTHGAGERAPDPHPAVLEDELEL